MAETKDDIEINEEGGKSKKMLIIIVAAVLLLGGGAAFFLMGGEEPASEEAVEAKPVKQAAIYHSIEKPLVVNFKKQSGGKVKYMQVKLKVMARDQTVIDDFKLHLPAIQHELLMLLFSQNYDAMNTKEGTRALRKEALTLINGILKAEGQENGLKSVYFTSLIMQ
jgi:flagellar FliL protein